jgi:predicted acetyltransferase
MLDEGYDVSMLFGIENFYTKFGYASSLVDSICKVKTRDAEVAGTRTQASTTRPIEEVDMPAVRALYNAHNATRTCSIVRTPENFVKVRKGTWWGRAPEATMLEDADGELLAYVFWDDNDKAVKVAEVESKDDALFPTLLSMIAEQGVIKRCEDIQLFIAPDHPFAEYVQRFGAEWTIYYPRHGSGMMRILNQQPLFEKIASELEKRLAVSPLAGFDGKLALRTDLGTTSLTFDGGRLSVGTEDAAMRLELSQDKLMQLVVGYRSVRDVVNEPDVKVLGDAVALLGAIFPGGFPYVWNADHF